MRDYPNRTVCTVLDEMRKCYETHNYAIMKSLIEEVQSLANRMEAALEDAHDAEWYRKERSKLRKEVKILEEKRDSLTEATASTENSKDVNS